METIRQIPRLKLEPYFVIRGLDTEKGQASIRMLWPAVFIVYLLFTHAQFEETFEYRSAWALACAHLAFAIWMIFWLRKHTDENAGRRMFAVVADQVLFAATLAMTGQIAAPFALMPLFFTFGSGLRYGRTYAVTSSTISSGLTCTVLLLSPYWAQYSTMRVGLAIAIILLPFYVFRLTDAVSLAMRLDSMTKLRNRVAFRELLERVCRNVAKAEYDSAVMVIDLDGFKRVNDEQGHDRGDEVLTHVAYLLHAELSPLGIPARVGGDEFAVLVEDLKDCVTLEAALARFLERTRGLSELFESPLGASIGVYYIKSKASVTPPFVFKAADELMYEAKRLGKNQVITSVGHSFTKEGKLIKAPAEVSIRATSAAVLPDPPISDGDPPWIVYT